MIYPEEFGLPEYFNYDCDLHLKDETATLCGKKLNHDGTRSRVKDTVLGGVICIGADNYAMTSSRSHDNSSHSYIVDYRSNRNLDWALCRIFSTLKLSNVNGSTRLMRYTKEADLPGISGPVKVLAGQGAEFEARLGIGDDLKLDAFPQVKLLGLTTQLPKEAIIPRGAWVVQGDSLCGYVVHCAPGANSRTGYMVPIERAFKEIKVMTEKEPVFEFLGN